MYEMPHQHGNIFILLEGQKHFINDYQEHFNVIQKLNHAGNGCWQQLELIWRETENKRCSD